MGTWGYTSFENDSALDWVEGELEGGCNLSPVSNALRAVLESDKEECLDFDQCAAAIAAAEVVAILRGAPPSKMPDFVREWVDSHRLRVAGDLVETALRVVHRVRTKSKMQEDWDQSPNVEQWRQALYELEERLRR